MLEDLIVAAVNEAGRKADEAIKSSVQGMLGGLKIPGTWRLRSQRACKLRCESKFEGGRNIVTLCRADGPAH